MKDFLTNDEEREVVEAIRAAEAQTSGEIRVVITSRWFLSPERRAWRLFERLDMTRTHHRNGALIVLFTRRRRFVVLGDIGLNAIVPADYWPRISDDLSSLLREGRKVDAITAAIRTLGGTMTAHWPPEFSNPDELPNSVIRD